MADQQSKPDQNGTRTLLAVNSSGELRRVVVNDDGTISGGGSSGLTDTQLRATPVAVDTELPAAQAFTSGSALPATAPIVPVLFGGDYGGSYFRVSVREMGQLAAILGEVGLNVNAMMLARSSDVTYLQPLRTPDKFIPLDAVSINAEATVWDPAASKKFRLMGYHLSASVAGNVLLKDGNGGTTIAVVPAGAGGSGSIVRLGNGILSAAADNNLRAIGPAASTLSGLLWGTEE